MPTQKIESFAGSDSSVQFKVLALACL